MNQVVLRILVVDDETAIRRALRPPLVELGFLVAEASRGEEALQMLRAVVYDAVLLDVNMPGIGGIETLRRIRAFAPRLPILMLTVRDQEEDKVQALDLGADDYVTKPFDTNELLARIRAALRYNRVAEGTQTHLAAQGLEIDLTNRRVSKFGQEVHLTPKEYAVLTELAKFPGRVITHHHLLKSVWPQGYERHVEYLRVVIRNLRQKIEADVSRPTIIVNELGVGYRLMGAEN